MNSGILIYTLTGAGMARTGARAEDFEDIVAGEPGLTACKPEHTHTMILYFDDAEKACKAISDGVYKFLLKLFNTDSLPREAAEYSEITCELCPEHMKADQYPSFAWSFAVGGKIIGSQIYLV